jgi:hypothetical protein
VTKEAPRNSKPNYQGFGPELSVEVAYLQAAHVLDVAVQMAIESRDIEQMQRLALTWMELAARMIDGPDTDDDDDDDDSTTEEVMVIGFGNHGGKADIVEE